MLFCSFIKGITPKICMFCSNKKCSFKPFMCLDLANVKKNREVTETCPDVVCYCEAKQRHGRDTDVACYAMTKGSDGETPGVCYFEILKKPVWDTDVAGCCVCVAWWLWDEAQKTNTDAVCYFDIRVNVGLFTQGKALPKELYIAHSMKQLSMKVQFLQKS